MTGDITPKDFLQTKLFELGQNAEKAKDAHFLAIGKIQYERLPQEEKDKKIADERETIRFFEGVYNGLSQASNEVRTMIPDSDKTENLAKLGLQLANWVHNSGFTKEEFKELKDLAKKIIEGS